MHETSQERKLLFAVAFRGVCRIGFDVMAVLSLVLRKAVVSDSHLDAQPPSVHEVEVDLSRFDGSGLHKKLRVGVDWGAQCRHRRHCMGTKRVPLPRLR